MAPRAGCAKIWTSVNEQNPQTTGSFKGLYSSLLHDLHTFSVFGILNIITHTGFAIRLRF